jgi:hypothetical protein
LAALLARCALALRVDSEWEAGSPRLIAGPNSSVDVRFDSRKEGAAPLERRARSGPFSGVGKNASGRGERPSSRQLLTVDMDVRNVLANLAHKYGLDPIHTRRVPAYKHGVGGVPPRLARSPRPSMRPHATQRRAERWRAAWRCAEAGSANPLLIATIRCLAERRAEAATVPTSRRSLVRARHRP